jgi:hypothetical protein
MAKLTTRGRRYGTLTPGRLVHFTQRSAPAPLATAGGVVNLCRRLTMESVPLRRCAITDCTRRYFQSGYCAAHHSRWRRHGDPLAGGTIRARANGFCFECDTPTPKGAYCSLLCQGRARQRRTRGYPRTADRRCQVCNEVMPRERFWYNKTCSAVCLVVQRRAYALTKRGAVTTPRELFLFLAERPKACAICGVQHRLCIDHDHHSGRLRGYLCSQCNVAIGFFADDGERLRRAIAYLEKAS